MKIPILGKSFYWTNSIKKCPRATEGLGGRIIEVATSKFS